METKEVLRLIQELSGLTQAQMAGRFGVTFAALNRWMNGRAAPRPAMQAKIDALFAEYAGTPRIMASATDAKRAIIARKHGSNGDVIGTILRNPDIRDQFYLSLTYNSNRIEGNTLSEGDTAAILFRNAAIKNNSIVEQLEVKNHQAALEYVLRHAHERGAIDEPFVLKLHAVLMNAIRDDAGAYRTHGVRIVGSYVPTANHQKIRALMAELVRDIRRKQRDHIAQITAIHSRFEQIHPFADGNGRVGRLLMHAMCLRAGLPPAVISEKRRREYLSCLNRAQLKDDIAPLEEFICDAILAGYRILER
jgi:Fic family protein